MNPREQKTKLPPSEFIFDEGWFVTIPLRDGLIAIREPHHFEDVFSYAIETEESVVLIDSGMGLSSIKKILKTIKPVHLLLTHTHWDHMGGAREFSDVKVLNHPYSLARIRTGWRLSETVGYEKKDFHVTVPNLTRLKDFDIPGCFSISTFENGDLITCEGLQIQVIATPGHTPDSVCFYLPSTGELFTGDTLYPGPEYLHLAESDHEQYLQSLHLIRQQAFGNISNIYPGHNEPTAKLSLLDNHISALEDNMPASSVELGKDEFGPYEERFYENFSLKLPRVDSQDRSKV